MNLVFINNGYFFKYITLDTKEFSFYANGFDDDIKFEILNHNDNEVELVKCNTAWQYNGGYRNSTYVNSHINGTYTYNVKGELIVTIGEYTDDNKDVPLRVINLDLDTHTNQVDDYNVAPNVPIANLKFISNVSGSPMPTGTYYFFIRYEITKNEYTNWFPIGVPYRAINEEAKTLFNHGQGLNPNQLSVTVNNTHKDVLKKW